MLWLLRVGRADGRDERTACKFEFEGSSRAVGCSAPTCEFQRQLVVAGAVVAVVVVAGGSGGGGGACTHTQQQQPLVRAASGGRNANTERPTLCARLATGRRRFSASLVSFSLSSKLEGLAHLRTRKRAAHTKSPHRDSGIRTILGKVSGVKRIREQRVGPTATSGSRHFVRQQRADAQKTTDRQTEKSQVSCLEFSVSTG